MTAQQLKNSILQMAVQGKLVPQDPNDEPASVLLERIRAEKEKLIKAGKIKREKNPSVIFRGSDNLPYEKIGKETRCIADEIPFEIPDSWAWSRCERLFQINPRNTIPDETLAGFMPMPMLQEGFQNSHSFEVRKWSEIKNGFTHFQNGDIVIAKITPCFQNRKSAIISGLPNECGAGTTELHVLRDVSGLLFMPFFLWIFKTHLFIEDGKKHFTGTAGQQRIGKDFISSCLIPLPPLAEQRRIVAKIEELLPHLDDYDRAETRVTKLNAEFPEQLKKSILQWAIQGKLVPQDPTDEPASVLLERIRAEKAKLVKAGKLKKDKNESAIFRRDNSHYEKLNGIERCIDDEIPFEIPDSWAWSRIGSCIELVNGRAYKQSELLDKGKYRVLRVGNFFTNSSWYYSDLELPSDKYCQKGDLLYAWSASFGPRIWDQGKTIFHYHIWNVKFDERLFLKEFLFYFLVWDKERLRGATTGSTMIHISMEHMYPRFIMIPPLAEQKRIVEAIELLFCKLSV